MLTVSKYVDCFYIVTIDSDEAVKAVGSRVELELMGSIER